jgi:ABC-2 type transport system permease protein
VIVANMALYRHDVHFDVSREGRNTPPPQFTAVIDHLQAPLSLTYFYNNGDDNALIAKSLIAVAARGHQQFAFRAADLDKEPGLARDFGVHAYNTAVFEAGGRKVMLENRVDVTRMAYAALRALKRISIIATSKP